MRVGGWAAQGSPEQGYSLPVKCLDPPHLLSSTQSSALCARNCLNMLAGFICPLEPYLRASPVCPALGSGCQLGSNNGKNGQQKRGEEESKANFLVFKKCHHRLLAACFPL